MRRWQGCVPRMMSGDLSAPSSVVLAFDAFSSLLFYCRDKHLNQKQRMEERFISSDSFQSTPGGSQDSNSRQESEATEERCFLEVAFRRLSS